MESDYFFQRKNLDLAGIKAKILNVLKYFHYSDPIKKAGMDDNFWIVTIYDSDKKLGCLCVITLTIRYSWPFMFSISYESNWDNTIELALYHEIRELLLNQLRDEKGSFME